MKQQLSILAIAILMANSAIAATAVNLHKQPLAYLNAQANGKVKIVKIRTDVDFNGVAHTRIQQTYEGIPVWNATGVIHTPSKKAGGKNKHAALATATTMNGKVYEGLEKDLASHAAFSTSDSSLHSTALQVAKNTYARSHRMNMANVKKEKSKPIIFIDDHQVAHYAYLTSFHYYTDTEAHQPISIVDAKTHHVYRSWEGIFTQSAQERLALNNARERLIRALHNETEDDLDIYDVIPGGVSGNTKIGEVIHDGSENHAPIAKALDVETMVAPGLSIKYTVCALQNDDIVIKDASYDSREVADICVVDAKDPKKVAWLSLDKGLKRWANDEMNEGYSPSLDAFYAANVVKNMYHDWYDTHALIQADGKPMKYIMRVHFGRHFDNAFWDGEQMTFGDGGKFFYPLASLGVTAHEISHGFTATHAQLDGWAPQMAALHESFSDMAAIATENYLTGKNTWDIGRDIKKDEGALRYLDNPTKDGESIDQLNDFDETEPHGAGGITNKAFYLLATTKGWNTHKAFDVWVKANMHYWDSSMTTLNEAACGVVSATKDYGYNVADVRIAFSKVGIDTDAC